jgi:hypothetical protein
MARATGTQALSVTAIQLPAQPCLEVAITNNDASIAMLIGWNATTQSFTLPATQTVVIQATNLNQLYAKSASGTPTLSYITS